MLEIQLTNLKGKKGSTFVKKVLENSWFNVFAHELAIVDMTNTHHKDGNKGMKQPRVREYHHM